MRLALLSTDDRENRRCYSVPNPIVPTPQAALLQGLEKHPDCEVHFISCVQERVNAPKKLGANIYYHALHVPKIGWLRTGYQGCIRAVRRKLREISPDIVHGQGTERDCAISAVFSGYPNVITIHGKMTRIAEVYRSPIGSYGWCAARLENFALSRTDGIICISSYVEKLVARHGVPSWVIPNALQRTFFDFPRTAASSAVPVLINVGVISGLKRQRKILEIWRELRAEGFDFEAIFVGASDSQNAYAVQFQAELKAAQAAGAPFSYLPRLEVEGLCQLFDTASAMVHFSEEETFGLVFGEALTRNLPLFASDVGSVRDIAAGVSGVEIFAPQDFPGLKNALRAWLQRGAGAGPRPSEAPIPITERYHPDVVARRHLEVYREVLAKRASGAL